MRNKIWFSYCWDDKSEGDFFYLVKELEDTKNIEVIYDERTLNGGKRIWPEIEKNIYDKTVTGFIYFLTPNSIKSNPCKEEFELAYNKMIEKGEDGFKLIGLLHNVSIDDISKRLKIRLCCSLKNPDWKRKIVDALNNKLPSVNDIEPESDLTWKIHSKYNGHEDRIAVEVRPKFKEIKGWRIGFPLSTKEYLREWGLGNANGGAISPPTVGYMEGITGIKTDNIDLIYYGGEDVLSSSISAYVVFEKKYPDFIFFAVAKGYMGPPAGEVDTFHIFIKKNLKIKDYKA